MFECMVHPFVAMGVQDDTESGRMMAHGIHAGRERPLGARGEAEEETAPVRTAGAARHPPAARTG
ncbi:hypothetical protein Pve01_41870 [Planomonospora venezuelensis]|nr:hypothetical protein Pve01_41870 [Planomonospora venezuelensis]